MLWLFVNVVDVLALCGFIYVMFWLVDVFLKLFFAGEGSRM